MQISRRKIGTINFSYDNADRRTLLTLPNGVTQAYGYDRDSEVTSLIYNHGSTNLGSLTYTYDLDGRQNTVSGSLGAVSTPVYIGE